MAHRPLPRSPNPLPRGVLLVASLSAALAVTLLASDTHAAEEPTIAPDSEPDTPAEPPAKAHDDVLLTAGVGAFSDGDQSFGGTLGATALRQKGWFGYGGTFEYGGAVFEYTVVTAAPMAGVFVPSPSWLRVGIAATAGIHSYDQVGKAFLGSDPGASGVTGFVGARAFLGAEVGGKARFHIGFQLAFDDDLSRVRHSYAFQENSSLGGGSRTEHATHVVGTYRFGTMLALGTAFDL